ncbi:MAG: CRTAC1 family protein [Gemmataceae bacterium]|nr:CRTAC1 family protein [Gemmataceae bacterium]
MAGRPYSRKVWAAAAVVALAAVGIAFAAWWRNGHGGAAGGTAGDRPPGFRDVAREAGLDFRMMFLPSEQGENFKINLYDHGSGVAVGDFDGDGRDDIYLVNQLGPNGLYHNNGDGTFTDVAARAGVAVGDRVCVAAAVSDYDNDGRQDLYVTSTRGGNLLFHNNGDGTFRDVTREAGVGHVGHSQTAAFFDYDGDGRLDLVVTNTASWTTGDRPRDGRHYPGPSTLWQLADSPREYNLLYHNNGDGTFTEVGEAAGVRGPGWGGDVAVFDYDGDGRPDLLVTNMFGASQLYRNAGGGTFADVTEGVLGRTSWGAIGSAAFDADTDGRLDLLIADMHSDMWIPPTTDPRDVDRVRGFAGRKFPHVTGPTRELAPAAFAELEPKIVALFDVRYDRVVFGNTLFRNAGGGRFEEVSDRAGVETFWPWGVAAGDFDNDGHNDVFVPSGMGHPYFYWPNSLLMNRGDGTFADRAAELGVEPPAGGVNQPDPIGGKPAARSSRCAATGDFDGDGRLEVVVNNFNDAPYLFKNQFPAKNSVAFRLRGTVSNRDAIGAVVTLRRGDQTLVRQVSPAGGYLSQSSKTVHFGLGDRAAVDSVHIRWPSGKVQVLDRPEANRLHEVVEPKD